MAYESKILQDSINQYGDRLTTFELEYPRLILAELNTHRMLSRNSASSRAIPTIKQLRKVLDDPFVPEQWGVNQSGMQAHELLDETETLIAKNVWLEARDQAVLKAIELIGGIYEINDESLIEKVRNLSGYSKNLEERKFRPIHKQLANRLLEPFMWNRSIVSATDWNNFFALRSNRDSQPEFQRLTELMKNNYANSCPVEKDQWHLPFIQIDELELSVDALKKISAGRCARVSYLTHDGKRDIEKDILLCEDLIKNGHMSPLEHVARPMTSKERRKSLYLGNFRGWYQFRKEFPYENDFSQIQL